MDIDLRRFEEFFTYRPASLWKILGKVFEGSSCEGQPVTVNPGTGDPGYYGGLQPDLKVGDVVVGEQFVEHDLEDPPSTCLRQMLS
jgi:hypothetical protein